MTHEHRTPPPAEQSSRITATAWIALAVIVAIIFVGVLAISHKSGVPAVAPGQSKVVALSTASR
ncbi:MAG TPA: hypothetical protein VJP88_10520 [Caulobacteraceae bacterium]|nr:hypothetical protein [Caulobacteraceae bacterium]